MTTMMRYLQRSKEAKKPPRIGIIGYGAFGRLTAAHLKQWFEVMAYDGAPGGAVGDDSVTSAGLDIVAACEVVIIATPVAVIADVVQSILPFLAHGAIVLDVGSVKVLPAEVMTRALPTTVDIIATHPLFGPESARNGIKGLKIALCPLSGRRFRLVERFLKEMCELDVILTTPERHDREVATSQALVHLIAKVLVQMEPLPQTMTTVSFDLLMQAIEMVRYDAPNVFAAIEHYNPYAGEVRDRFFSLARNVGESLAATSKGPNAE